MLDTIFLSAVDAYSYGCDSVEPGKRLIIFTRYPVPGRTKTRLIPTLGPQGAADLQQSFHVVSAVVGGAHRTVGTRGAIIECVGSGHCSTCCVYSFS